MAEKYYNISSYAYCANNPVNFVDPDGRSTWVTENADGTYNVVGGNLNDNDLNIYIVTYDEYGNMKIGDSIGTTTSITSFYNTDKDDGIGGWMTESIINPSDQSGINFINNIQQQYLTLPQYIWNARTDKPYDFKVTNGQGEKIDGIDIYRGMPIGSDQNGTVYTSARDLGNIVAGYMAGSKGLSWCLTRLGFDGYQSHVSEGIKWTPEGLSTRNAQAVGWTIGYKKYYKNIRLNDK